MTASDFQYTLHQHDLPEDFVSGTSIAVDTETMGLNLWRDRLCLVQVCNGDNHAHLLKIAPKQAEAPRLSALLADPNVRIICHFARFDLAVLYRAFGVMPSNIWCTRTASKLVRTNTNNHSLRHLCYDYLGVTLDKQQQQSDWADDKLTDSQLRYAASDVVYLHRLIPHLEHYLRRENRFDFALECFETIRTIAKLDTMGWHDLFEH